MANFNFDVMQEMQKDLRENGNGKKAPIAPKYGKEELMNLFIEVGEAADIIKKHGDTAIMQNHEIRTWFIEEMCDTLMYFNDVMLCYRISPEELERIYLKKHKRNLDRW